MIMFTLKTAAKCCAGLVLQNYNIATGTAIKNRALYINFVASHYF